jgi:germination protein M
MQRLIGRCSETPRQGRAQKLREARVKRITLWARVVALPAMFIFLSASACGSGHDASPSERKASSRRAAAPGEPAGQPPSPDSSDASAVALQVWFQKGDTLFPVTRVQERTSAVGAAALRALLRGPSEQESALDIASSVPGGTKLLGLDISDGLATVDLSNDFQSGGGSSAMLMRLAQVVYTITQFPTVDEVELRLDGEAVDVFSDEDIIVDEPQSRKDYRQLLAPIVVLAPSIGKEVDSPMVVSGTADVFEATVSMTLLDANGDVIVDEFTTATCGTGCRGDYTTQLRFEIGDRQPGTLQVFESSAEDGRPLHMVAIPVVLVP